MSLPDGVTTCLLTYGPITDTFGNLADSITVEVVADRTIVHAASGRTMFKHPVSVTAEGGGVAQLPVPHTDQAGFRDQQQNALTGWYYTVTLTARFPGGGFETDRKTFQPLVGQVTRDADLLPSPGMVTPGVTVGGTAVTSVNGQTGAVDLSATFAPLDSPAFTGEPTVNGEPIGSGGGGDYAPLVDGLVPRANLPVPLSGYDTPMEGASVFIHGHSWTQGSLDSKGGVAGRLTRRAGLGGITNRGVSGQSLSSSVASALRVDYFTITGAKYSTLLLGLVNTVNDIYVAGFTANALPAKVQASVKNHVAAFIYWHRTVPSNPGNVRSTSGTATGTWGTVTDLNSTSECEVRQTVIQNASLAFSIGDPPSRRVIVMLQGIDNAAATAASVPLGAAFAIETRQGGGGWVAGPTGTTADQFFKGRDTYVRGAMPVPVTLPAGHDQVRVTKTDADGTMLSVSSVLVQSKVGDGPNQFIVLDPPTVEAAYPADIGLALHPLVRAAIATVGGEDQDVFICDPHGEGLWDLALVYTAGGDTFHPNDEGHQRLTDSVQAAFNRAVFHPGQNNANRPASFGSGIAT